MSEPIIELKNVNFWYDKGKPAELWALKNINITVEKGEYAAFFGPSGSGKTSLLYLVAGIERSHGGTGEILINGKDIAKFTAQELAIYRQVGVGMIFQQFNLIPTLSVVNNVALPMAFFGISGERRRKRAMELLDRLAISHLAERMPYELSGGQQQRVGIARALANNPPIIIADEPLGNLDSENSQRVLAFLKELNEQDNRTIIMVTHEAWSLRDAKKIFYIKDGEVVKTEKASPKVMAMSITQHLFGEMSPKASVNEITAQSLSNLFLRGYSPEEMERFQVLVEQRIEGKINGTQFLLALDKPFKEGGVGLWFQKARKVSDYVEDIVEKRTELDQIHKEMENKPETSLMAAAQNLRYWLIKDYKGGLNFLELEKLDEIIRERMQGVIDYEGFKKTLNLPKSKMGIGIPIRSALKMSQKIEMALKSPEIGQITGT